MEEKRINALRVEPRTPTPGIDPLIVDEHDRKRRKNKERFREWVPGQLYIYLFILQFPPNLPRAPNA